LRNKRRKRRDGKEFIIREVGDGKGRDGKWLEWERE